VAAGLYCKKIGRTLTPRTVQIPLCQTKNENAVRYMGVKVDDALIIAPVPQGGGQAAHL
jgi:hypothetical protein